MDNSDLVDFIEIYKKNRCLWDTKSKNYTHKQSRYDALQQLLTIMKKSNETANIQSVRKKVDTIRTNYKRERKKVILSEFVYRPTLWYYDRLAFLSEIDTVQDDVDPLEERESDTSVRSPVPRKKAKRTPKIKMKAEQISDEPDDNYYIDQPLSHEPDDNYCNDEYAAFGKMIELEIKKLKNPEQSIAQKLISDVIFYSKLGKLTIDSFISIPLAPIIVTNCSNQKSDCNTPNISTSLAQPSRTPSPNSSLAQISTPCSDLDDHNLPTLHIRESSNQTHRVKSLNTRTLPSL